MTKLINLFGAPASGKTTVSYAVSAELKKAGKTVFLAQEFATELILAGQIKELANQDIIFAEMVRRIKLAWNKVDYIVTDCPLLLNLIYLYKRSEGVSKEDEQLVHELQLATEKHIIAEHRFRKGVNILLEFNEAFYSPANRIGSPDECREIEQLVKDMFARIDEPYTICKAEDMDKIMNLIKSFE